MKTVRLLLLALLAAPFVSWGAEEVPSPRTWGTGYYSARVETNERGDSTLVIDMLPLYVFKRPADLRKYNRLIYNLKKVYPIAKHANYLLHKTEEKMEAMPNDRTRRAYIKEFERQLKEAYTPVLKQMTFSQGKLLIKLIDRETTHTTYDLVKDLRGSFTAFFWQGVARIFGANLKDQYDKEGDDRVIEQLVLLYDAGLL